MSLARTTDPQTSHDAARNKRDVRAEILAAFKRRPVRGWTDSELEPVIVAATGVTPQRVRTVRKELTAWSYDGLAAACPIRPLGTTRTTPTGHRAQVYALR